MDLKGYSRTKLIKIFEFRPVKEYNKKTLILQPKNRHEKHSYKLSI